MANAITARIGEGENVPLEEYLLHCARMCGPLVHMREDSFDTPIRLRDGVPSYRYDSLKKAEEQLQAAQKITIEEAEAIVEKQYQEAIQDYKRAIKECAKLQERYEAMLAKVKAWEPPTEEHQYVKEAGIKDLEASIRFDCRVSYSEPVKSDPAEYIQQLQEMVERQVKYHKDAIQKEEEHVKWANDWITTLVDCLEGEK